MRTTKDLGQRTDRGEPQPPHPASDVGGAGVPASVAERERFEAWYRAAFGFEAMAMKDCDGHYYGGIDLAWQAWQARAAMAPPPPDTGERTP